MRRITNTFEDLKSWKEAHKLVIMVYKATSDFPAEERYRLTDQICKSASSTAAILVEGNARKSPREYIHFAYQSRASLED